MHGDAQASVIVVAHILPIGFRVMALECWPGELSRWGVGDFLPEPLGRFDVGALVDSHAELSLNPPIDMLCQ